MKNRKKGNSRKIVELKGLVDQPNGKELEYRVIAINKSGEGQVSNTVMAVL